MTLFSFARVSDKITFVASFEVDFTFHFAALFTFFGGTVFPRQGRVGNFIKCNDCEERVGFLCRWCLPEQYGGVGR